MSSMLLCDFHIHTTWAERLNKTITGENFVAYLDELRAEAKRAQERYGMLVLPGAEITKNYLSEKESAHVLILAKSSRRIFPGWKPMNPGRRWPDVPYCTFVPRPSAQAFRNDARQGIGKAGAFASFGDGVPDFPERKRRKDLQFPGPPGARGEVSRPQQPPHGSLPAAIYLPFQINVSRAPTSRDTESVSARFPERIDISITGRIW